MKVLLPLLTVTALTCIPPFVVHAERLSLVQHRENPGPQKIGVPLARVGTDFDAAPSFDAVDG